MNISAANHPEQAPSLRGTAGDEAIQVEKQIASSNQALLAMTIHKIISVYLLNPNTMIMKKRLLLPLCLLWPALCLSQDWFPVASNNEGVVVKVDLSSIERVGDLIYCWEEKSCMDEEVRMKEAKRMSEAMEDKKWLKYDFTFNYKVYDCAGMRSQTLSTVVYSTTGRTLYSDDTPESDENFKDLIPGSMGMSVFNALTEIFLFEFDGVEYDVYIEDIFSFCKEYPDAVYLGDVEWVEYLLFINKSP